MRKYQYILFDLDGTLIDSAPAILASFRAAFIGAGISPVRAIDESVVGPPLLETLEMLSGSCDISLIKKLADQFKASYDDGGYMATSAYLGVSDMLHELSAAGFYLAIATNKRILPTRLILDYLGWSAWFEDVYALDSFDPRLKDKAAMIERLLVDRGIPRSGAIYVGDRAEDGEAANDNGLPFIAATWGYGSLESDSMHKTWRAIRSPAELVTIAVG